MKYLKKYNESLLEIERDLMNDIYDISHEIRDLGYRCCCGKKINTQKIA